MKKPKMGLRKRSVIAFDTYTKACTYLERSIIRLRKQGIPESEVILTGYLIKGSFQKFMDDLNDKEYPKKESGV